MTHVGNSYSQHPKRGTWFSSIHRRWYELDGFLMRNRERQQHVRKICTVGEAALSDQKPKKLRLDLKKRRWREAHVGKRVPMVKWEGLSNDQVAGQFRQRMEEVIGERDEEPVGGVETSGWAELAEKAVDVAKEVCGVRSRRVENPWMVGR